MKVIEPINAIKQIQEYKVVPQEVWHSAHADAFLKLDWNEAPHVSPRVRTVLLRFIEQGFFHWYPDVASTSLNERLAKKNGIREDQILTFNGSDVALETVVRVFAESSTTVAWVTPSYDQFRVFVQSLGAQLVPIQVDPASVDFDRILERVMTVRPKILYLNNPNNPIGYFFHPDKIENLVKCLETTLVLLDEAYVEFAGESSIDLVQRYPNLVVFRSFSKAYAMAGLRLGYIASDHRNLIHVNKIRNGKNVSMLAQLAAIASLDNYAEVQASINEITNARAYFCDALTSLKIGFFESYGNFVLIRCPRPAEFVLLMQAHGVFVRDRSYLPGLKGTARVTIGTKEMMKRVVQIIENNFEKIFH